MERNKKTLPLFLLLALTHVCHTRQNNCSSQPHKVLPCLTDFNSTITCDWNSTLVADDTDTICTIHAQRIHHRNPYKSSCVLVPVNNSSTRLQRCSLDFKRKRNFYFTDELTINLTCNHGEQNLRIFYKPSCHIKLNRPPKPDVNNSTTVSWLSEVTKNTRFDYSSQLQWKQENQSWSDPLMQTEYDIFKECEWRCTADLPEDLLIKDARHEARVRVKPASPGYSSTWSDWSPTVSWVSHIGNAKPTPTPTPEPPPPPPSDVAMGVLGTLSCAVAFALLLILFKNDKTAWIYKVKGFVYPPVPNPAVALKDTDFKSWLSPFFDYGSIHSLLEIVSTVDVIMPSRPEATLQEKTGIEKSPELNNSSFSNPNYSHVSPPHPPVSSLTAGNLEACGADTPYGPVACQGEGKNAEQDRDEVREKEAEILQLLSKCSNNSEHMPVVSDYEKVEKPLVERLRLHSLDSGVCNGEEVSQESLEADSINMTDCHDEEPESNEEREDGRAKEGDFQKLFRGIGGIFDKGSIQVCSGYEQVQRLQADSPELHSLDSGISSAGEEQLSQEESLEDIDKSTESTSLLFPPRAPPSCALACSSPSFTPLPMNFSGAGLSPALQPLPSHIMERIALMSTNRSVEPSVDGYMPVRQEQS